MDLSLVARRSSLVVSYLINPIVLPPITYGLMLEHFGAPVRERMAIVAIVAVCFSLVPFLFVVRMVQTGQVETIEVRERVKRKLPLLVSVASSLAGLALIASVSVTMRTFVVGTAVFYLLNLILALMITLRWKISLHLIGFCGTLTTLFLIAATPWPEPIRGTLTIAGVLPFMGLVPVLMWARVRSGAHTLAQVVVGGLFGFGVTYLQLYGLVHLTVG